MGRALRILLLMVCGLLAAAAASGAQAAERRVALVIGNAAYKNPALEIPNARNDAEDVAASLRAIGFDVLLGSDVDLAQASKIIQQFARMSVGADATLFYYAGHAIQYQGRNYLLPVDAEVRDEISLPFETIAVDNIRAVLDRSSGVKIMVLDACRSNPIADRLAKVASAAPAVEPAERTRGLERIDKAEGIIVAYATSPGDVALDGRERNSPFTKAFLKRLAEPGLEVEMMFRRIASDVREATGGRQRPETYVSLVNEYYLNQNDRLAWEKIEGSDDPAALEDFIERFPSSFHAIEARYRLKVLERALAAAKERALKEAEVSRREKQAAAEEAARRLKAEEACRADRAALTAALSAAPRDAEVLRRLAFGACDDVKTVAAQKLAEVEAALAAEAEACRRDGETLAGLGHARDVDALRALTQATPCAAVKASAAATLAALEAQAAKAAELCRREEGEIKAMIERGDGAGLDALRARPQCPASLPAIAAGLQKIAAAAKTACDRSAAALQAIPERDVAALKSFLAGEACEPVKTVAQARLKEVETTLAREAAQCESEALSLRALVERGDGEAVKALRGKAQCPGTLAAADKGLLQIAAAASAACAREEAALRALRPDDVASLRAFADRAACAAVHAAAGQRLAEAEAAARREVELCAKDDAQWRELSGSGDRAAVEQFGRRVECAAVRPQVEKRLTELKTLCAADDSSLASLRAGDAEALRGFVAAARCNAAKSEASRRLAALEAAAAREAEICRRDEAAWRELETSQDGAAIGALRARAECAGVKTAADRRLAEIKTLCAADAASLGAVEGRDRAALASFVGAARCDEVKAVAGRRLAKLDETLAREAQACERDERLLKAVAADAAALGALRAKVECASVAAALDGSLAALRADCVREQGALAAIPAGDRAATGAFLEGASCAEAKTAAKARIAALDAEDARREESCRKEDLQFATLKAGEDPHSGLEALRKGMSCERLRPQVEAALEQLPAPPSAEDRIRAAQAQLQRLGCLGPVDSGAFDAKTKAGLGRFFKAKREAANPRGFKVTDEFVVRLQGEADGLCAPANVARPAGHAVRSKKDVARLPPREAPVERSEPKPQHKQAAKPPPERPTRVARPQPQERARPATPPPAQSTAKRDSPAHTASPIGVGF